MPVVDIKTMTQRAQKSSGDGPKGISKQEFLDLKDAYKQGPPSDEVKGWLKKENPELAKSLESNDDYSTYSRAAGPAQKPEDRAAERTKLVKDMTPGLDAKDREQADQAMKSFSNEQLKEMRDQGVKMYYHGKVPAERAGSADSEDRKDANAWYDPRTRTIVLKDSGRNPKTMRHELTHAWDDVRNDDVKFDDKASKSDREAVMSRLDKDLSLTSAQEKLDRSRIKGDPWLQYSLVKSAEEDVKAGQGGKPGSFSSDDKEMRGAYDAYLKRSLKEHLTVDTTLDWNRQSLENPREFYARGSAIFYEGNNDERYRMKQKAPELYALLEREARTNGVDVPEPPTAPVSRSVKYEDVFGP